MPNPSIKFACLCACILAGSPAAMAQQTGAKAGASYHPPIKIEASPARFPLSGTISVTASVYNKRNGGANPPGIFLRVVPADANGNYPASGGTSYPKPPTPTAPKTPQPIGAQNWAHWSNATFDQVTVPAPAQKIAIIAQYVEWNRIARLWIQPPGAENRGVAIFRKRCIPINGKAECLWSKE